MGLKQLFFIILINNPFHLFSQPLPNSKETLSVESDMFQLSVPKQEELKGGHIQGIQLQKGTLIVSGSSKQFAYLSIFQKLGTGFRFLGIKKLAANPLNHAGGFQIADNWLAVGVEDPKGKRQSIVQLIDVSNFKAISAPPVYTLKRKGEYKLSTAGAVALVKRKTHFLLAVGSWDCTTIDLYTSNHLDPCAEDFKFELWTSWDSREAVRKKWSSKSYGNYQSLQLTEDSTGLYITGFYRAANRTDLADVYRLNTDASPYTLMQKVASYSVQCKDEITFRNGAGLCTFNGKSSIIAVGRTLTPKMQVQVFPITID